MWLGAISGSPLRDVLQEEVLTGRVIGGSEAKAHSWKWQVMLVSLRLEESPVPEHVSSETLSFHCPQPHTSSLMAQHGLGAKYVVVRGRYRFRLPMLTPQGTTLTFVVEP